MDLAGALGLRERELLAFVGAGGKKTAMGHLLRAGADRGIRVGYTTTTHMPPPGDHRLIVREDERELSAALERRDGPIAFARSRVENPARAAAKVRGHDPGTVDRLFDAGTFDWLLVKADGARRREFKAPGPDEPVIPARSTHVVPVASARAVGRPLDEATVHRPELVASITGLELGDEITPAAIGTVLASDEGGCKGVSDDATVTPLVNKADTASLREAALEALLVALQRTDRFENGLVCSFDTDALETIER